MHIKKDPAERNYNAKLGKFWDFVLYYVICSATRCNNRIFVIALIVTKKSMCLVIQRGVVETNGFYARSTIQTSSLSFLIVSLTTQILHVLNIFKNIVLSGKPNPTSTLQARVTRSDRLDFEGSPEHVRLVDPD
jgi:hypothetical protein